MLSLKLTADPKPRPIVEELTSASFQRTKSKRKERSGVER